MKVRGAASEISRNFRSRLVVVLLLSAPREVVREAVESPPPSIPLPKYLLLLYSGGVEGWREGGREGGRYEERCGEIEFQQHLAAGYSSSGLGDKSCRSPAKSSKRQGN